MKRVAISQSNYIPWFGYFRMLASVDDFVFFDSAQFTKRDWRTRNKVLADSGPKWLSIPVQVKGNSRLPIREIRVAHSRWRRDHLEIIRQSYRRALGFKVYFPMIEDILMNATSPFLSENNKSIISRFSDLLGIDTRLWDDSEFSFASDLAASERLSSIAESLGASVYVTGPAARKYLDEACFHSRGIEVEYFDYSPLFGYSQVQVSTFVSHLSIVDVLLNGGELAASKVCRSPDRGAGK